MGGQASVGLWPSVCPPFHGAGTEAPAHLAPNPPGSRDPLPGWCPNRVPLRVPAQGQDQSPYPVLGPVGLGRPLGLRPAPTCPWGGAGGWVTGPQAGCAGPSAGAASSLGFPGSRTGGPCGTSPGPGHPRPPACGSAQGVGFSGRAWRNPSSRPAAGPAASHCPLEDPGVRDFPGRVRGREAWGTRAGQGEAGRPGSPHRHAPPGSPEPNGPPPPRPLRPPPGGQHFPSQPSTPPRLDVPVVWPWPRATEPCGPGSPWLPGPFAPCPGVPSSTARGRHPPQGQLAPSSGSTDRCPLGRSHGPGVGHGGRGAAGFPAGQPLPLPDFGLPPLC